MRANWVRLSLSERGYRLGREQNVLELVLAEVQHRPCLRELAITAITISTKAALSNIHTKVPIVPINPNQYVTCFRK